MVGIGVMLMRPYIEINASIHQAKMSVDQRVPVPPSRGAAIVGRIAILCSLGLFPSTSSAELFGPCSCRTNIPFTNGTRLNPRSGMIAISLTSEGWTTACPGTPYPNWGFTADGRRRSAMKIDGADFEDEISACGGSTGDSQYCTIPPMLPDGPHTGVTRCITASENGDVEYTHAFNFSVDATAPTLSITAPLQDSVQPIIGFHAEGGSDGSSIEISLVSTIFGRGGIYRTLSNTGGQWSTDYTAEDLVPLIDSLGPPTTMQLYVTASDGINSASQSITFWFDGVGPTLAFLSPSGASGLNNLTTISGTARDISGIDHMTLAVKDITINKYWNPNSRKFDSQQPIEFNLTANTGDPDVTILWSYSLLTARYLQPSHAYTISVTAFDQYGNKSTIATTDTFTRGLIRIAETPIGFGGARTALFSPGNETVVWGGFDERPLCVSFADNIRSQPFWKNSVQVSSDDGALLLAAAFGAGICNGNADKLEVKVRSNPISCARQGTVRVYFERTIVGEAAIAVVAPHRTYATLLPQESNLGAGQNPAAECASVGASAPCRIDHWRLRLDAGPFEPIISDPRTMNLRWIENQRRLTPLTLNGVRMKMCPAKLKTQSVWTSLPMGFDDVGYGAPLGQSCGEASKQGFRFFSNYTQQLAACEFISDITKTSYLDAKQRLTTTRSDDH